MPRRVESDEEDSKPKRKKLNIIRKPREKTNKPSAAAKKKESVPNSNDSAVSTWAKRRTLESLDAIEDVDAISPKKGRRKLAFEVDDGSSLVVVGLIVDFERVPPVAQLAVHKKKVGEVSNWLKEFPHHRKVRLSFIYYILSALMGEITRSFRTGGGWQIYHNSKSRSKFRFPCHRMDKPGR